MIIIEVQISPSMSFEPVIKKNFFKTYPSKWPITNHIKKIQYCPEHQGILLFCLNTPFLTSKLYYDSKFDILHPTLIDKYNLIS